MNKEAAISAMLTGLIHTSYIVYLSSSIQALIQVNWWFGISPEGIGTLGMIFSFFVALVVSRFTVLLLRNPKPIDDIRVPVNGLEKVNET